MTIRLICSVLLSAVVCLAFTTEATGKEIRRFALIVGTNRAPEENMNALRYADDDAVQYFELFRHATSSVVLLTMMDAETQQRFSGMVREAKPPTMANLVEALHMIFSAIDAAKVEGAETELYFIYSGHGRLLPGQEGAITLEDGILTRSDLYSLLIEKSPADFNHLIIDACNAYFMVHRRGEGGDEEGADWENDSSGRQRAEVKAFFDEQDLARFPNTGVLLSTTTEAETHEWSRYEGGIFSHEVRSGLLGAADITEDGFIEYSEMQAFVRAANHRIADPRAKLDIHARPPAQDQRRPVFDLLALKKAVLLDIPEMTTGRFYLEDDRGARLADFNKSAEQNLTIALLSRSTYFLREENDGLEYEIQPAAAGKRMSLAAMESRPLPVAGRGAVERTFRAFLFTQP